MGEEKVYIGTKVVRAIPMDRDSYLREKGTPSDSNEENMHGYKVTYEDGYVSWSPENVFERCYREITDSEKSMI